MSFPTLAGPWQAIGGHGRRDGYHSDAPVPAAPSAAPFRSAESRKEPQNATADTESA
ncbi:hypothetical protein GCM10010302_67470 [Streptomyces polychromogenes]|uniref:Uncharacterized protein n=1 Tax=Streptomyces polychromogenes TaxID=67342 RepID=A0ABN0VWL8_9ACTN